MSNIEHRMKNIEGQENRVNPCKSASMDYSSEFSVPAVAQKFVVFLACSDHGGHNSRRPKRE